MTSAEFKGFEEYSASSLYKRRLTATFTDIFDGVDPQLMPTDESYHLVKITRWEIEGVTFLAMRKLDEAFDRYVQLIRISQTPDSFIEMRIYHYDQTEGLLEVLNNLLTLEEVATIYEDVTAFHSLTDGMTEQFVQKATTASAVDYMDFLADSLSYEESFRS